ncbi:MAG TPA: hypothetical protein VLG40_05405 [Candidatus Saccharimonas sp.]|nr:hypothetical protein [Candidatus Saccharimonas sp.]
MRTIRKNAIPVVLGLAAIYLIVQLASNSNAAEQRNQDLHAGDIARVQTAVAAQGWHIDDITYIADGDVQAQIILSNACTLVVDADPLKPEEANVTVRARKGNAQGYDTSAPFPFKELTPNTALFSLRVSNNC